MSIHEADGAGSKPHQLRGIDDVALPNLVERTGRDKVLMRVFGLEQSHEGFQFLECFT